MSTRARVYLTPLRVDGAYDAEIDISDWVEDSGIQISRSIDSTDYSVGVYTFDDVTLRCENSEGLFSESSDSRSLFPASRDLAKVRLVYDDGTSETTLFHGLINEEGTTVDPTDDSVTFSVLSPDSILKKSQIVSGTVTAGMTFTQALVAILNTVDVRSVLTIELANINPAYNGSIDVAGPFDDSNKRDAIASLLGVANSVLRIDASNRLIVQDRSESTGNPVTYLYGKTNANGRENISLLQNYNSGIQRLFNSIVVKGGQRQIVIDGEELTAPQVVREYHDEDSKVLYGLRQKEMTFEFMTDPDSLDAAAQSIVNEFRYPKIECEVTVPLEDVLTVDLLDLVSIDYPLRIAPAGRFLPIYGITKYGDTDSPYPYVTGAITIDAGTAFKVIGRDDDLSTYETTLKLRQVGTTLTDGVF